MPDTESPARFRKKPVDVEAMRFDGLESYLEIVKWMKASGDTHALANEVRYETPIMLLHTLEGTMAANPGDYIIRGVKGEFYPCKPDIFAATYEAAPEPLELTPVEQAAVDRSEHMSTCHEQPCVDCMRELRAIRRIVKAVRPVIEAEQAQTMEGIRTQAEIAALRWAADRIDPGPASQRPEPIDDTHDMQMTCDRGVATRLRLWANLRADGPPVAAASESTSSAGEPEGATQR